MLTWVGLVAAFWLGAICGLHEHEEVFGVAIFITVGTLLFLAIRGLLL